MNLVDAQQARRLLDRIVGYKLSPVLWKNIKSGLSAGRVQSVATKIIVDRENEIRAFIPKEYWTIDALIKADNGKTFESRFYGLEKDGCKVELECEADAMKVFNTVDGKDFLVSEIKTGKKFKNPAPPFTTSTMQQEASRRLGFQASKTMRVAQELYDGLNLGHDKDISA